MFDYSDGMAVMILNESGGGAEVWYRWRCDCGELGGWSFDRSKVEAEARQHTCDGRPPLGNRDEAPALT
jgi:hypothetical protein